eukprot:scaffold29975_cov49-Phaeocystis_antarctica.AAC.2
MATARSTTARNLRVAETYTDVRGEGVKKRLTRRAGGGHGQRQKRGWGAKRQSPPSCTRGLAATSTYEVNIEGTGRGGGGVHVAFDRPGSSRCLHTSASA